MNQRLSESIGFTLVELLVAISVLMVLTAVVVPSVTGLSTAARGQVQQLETLQMASAIARFNADTGAWPTKASPAGASPGWPAQSLPANAYTASGSTYTFTISSIAGVDFGAAYGLTAFVPDYTSNPRHTADAPISVPAGQTAQITINRQGITTTVILSNTTPSSDGSTQAFDVWSIDSRGSVWSFVSREDY